MNALNILHLSDLHIGNFKYDEPHSLPITIANTLSDSSRLIDIIVVSGDIFDGRSKAIENDRKFAVSFFQTLIDQINRKKLSENLLTRDDVLFVPGNHDLMRSETETYQKYDAFINDFRQGATPSKLTMIDSYNFIYDVPDKKIAVLGFNSCRIKIEQVKEKDLDWVGKLDLNKFGDEADAIRQTIVAHKESEIKWDDHGHIDPIEMDNVFTTLKEKVPAYRDYTLLATFHHHFYPFPEIVKTRPDASVIRNYSTVLDQFQRYGIKIVLHGHKHLAIQRVLTDNKYFENPNSIIYVLAAGSIGHREIYHPSFQWLRVYDRTHQQIAEGERYDFKDEELDHTKSFQLPPVGKDEKTISVGLLDALYTEAPQLFSRYKEITNEFEQVVIDSQIVKVIDMVGSLLTIFNDIKLELRKNSKITYLLLLILNYRVIFLKNQQEEHESFGRLLKLLEDEILLILQTDSYAESLLKFISSVNNSQLEQNYAGIIKNVSSDHKRIGAYCSIAIFVNDLYLNISNYGEYYFEREKLNHKINLKLVSETFYNSIPSDSISIEGDIDRRAILLNFKSKNPTVHKIAVLIVKDFEMRLDKFEDSLKEIKLKLYYIIPKVQVDKYDLENFHFDAYIPTLLPLLTGDNLYKSKEVFIRELVQNSIDATLLRTKLTPDEEFDTQINIIMGTELRDGKRVKYFRIIDNGVGMSKFTIERYFTSIGRSYYVSEEFDELKKDKKIRYNAISNFGIGFLSSFMVCKEVMVQTKYIYPDSELDGLEIEIPNYDGCFFIRKIHKESIGTDITLYEDERRLFSFKKFGDYIKKTLIGLPINIIYGQDNGKSSNLIAAYSFHQAMLEKLQIDEQVVFYIPFSEAENCVQAKKWSELLENKVEDIEKYGVWINFSEFLHRNLFKDSVICLNQGLYISYTHIPFKYDKDGLCPSLRINYPSSFIQLDVAREKVISLKPAISLDAFETELIKQAHDFIETSKIIGKRTTLADIHFLNASLTSAFLIDGAKGIYEKTYVLKLEKVSTGLELALCRVGQIPLDYDYAAICYFEFRSKQFRERVEKFFSNVLLIGIETEADPTVDKDAKDFFNQNFVKNDMGKYQERVYVDYIDIDQLDISQGKSKVGYNRRNALLMRNEIDIMLNLKRYENLEKINLDTFCHGLIQLFTTSAKKSKVYRREQGYDILHILTFIKSTIYNKLTVGEAEKFSLSLNFEKLGLKMELVRSN